jgi:hypothetical protein
VVELVDTRHSKCRFFGSAGSIPATGTTIKDNTYINQLDRR